jgi:hypothetical protein
MRVEQFVVNTSEAGMLGIQVTLVGLFIVVFFEGLFPYPLLGLLLGGIGTAVVMMALFTRSWE